MSARYDTKRRKAPPPLTSFHYTAVFLTLASVQYSLHLDRDEDDSGLIIVMGGGQTGRRMLEEKGGGGRDREKLKFPFFMPRRTCTTFQGRLGRSNKKKKDENAKTQYAKRKTKLGSDWSASRKSKEAYFRLITLMLYEKARFRFQPRKIPYIQHICFGRVFFFSRKRKTQLTWNVCFGGDASALPGMSGRLLLSRSSPHDD